MRDYQFSGAFGKDRIIDADGLGAVQIDGQSLASAKGLGQRNVWAAELKDAAGAATGVYAGLAVYDDARSSTGKRLVITKGGDSSNSITIDNFDLARAHGAQGWLGIQLGAGRRLALVQGASQSSFHGASTPPGWRSDETWQRRQGAQHAASRIRVALIVSPAQDNAVAQSRLHGNGGWRRALPMPWA